MRAWEERDTNHMYSAMIFSVVSERLRLIKSESRAIFQNKERNSSLKAEAERDIMCSLVYVRSGVATGSALVL